MSPESSVSGVSSENAVSREHRGRAPAPVRHAPPPGFPVYRVVLHHSGRWPPLSGREKSGQGNVGDWRDDRGQAVVRLPDNGQPAGLSHEHGDRHNDYGGGKISKYGDKR